MFKTILRYHVAGEMQVIETPVYPYEIALVEFADKFLLPSTEMEVRSKEGARVIYTVQKVLDEEAEDVQVPSDDGAIESEETGGSGRSSDLLHDSSGSRKRHPANDRRAVRD